MLYGFDFFMQKLPTLSIFLMSILLAGAVAPSLNSFQILDTVLPNTYVDYAFAQTEDTNATNTEDTDETDTEDTDETDTEDDDQTTNLGQEVSTFVHESKDQFRSQKEETKAIITQCRVLLENVTPEERSDIKKQCRADLDEVKESYKQLRQTYQDVFKEFKVHVKSILQDPDNVSPIMALNSLTQQEERKDRINELRMQIQEELRTEIKDLREQMKVERETMREEVQNMIDEGVDREKIKEELQTMREQMKAEQEQMKEQMKEEREKMKEEREKMKASADNSDTDETDTEATDETDTEATDETDTEATNATNTDETEDETQG